MTATRNAYLDRSPLSEGDTVAIIAPSGPPSNAGVERAIDQFRSWGLKVVLGEHVLRKHPRASYLAGEDDTRRSDLQAAWRDPDIDAVICARGGYGAMRLLDGINWQEMRRTGTRRDGSPKLLAGSSDVTALHEAFRVHLDVPTLFCPMPATGVFRDSELVRSDIRRWFFEPWRGRGIVGAKTEALCSGSASGRFVGGNLSLLAAGVGSPEAQQSTDNILFIEEVDEELYKLDNLMLQLRRSGRLEAASGIVLGSWHNCAEPDAIRDLMVEYLAPLEIPVLWEQSFGHDPNALSVPLNVSGTLKSSADDISLTVTG